jgi:hypothetical protein
MAIITGVTDSFLSEVLQGVHSSTDTYKLALYTDAATLGNATTVYTVDGEHSSTMLDGQGQTVPNGYTAGGNILTGYAVTFIGGKAVLDFTDTYWDNVSFTARGAMIYNSTKDNKALHIMDFGKTVTSTDSRFTVTLPEPTATTGVIRLGRV